MARPLLDRGAGGTVAAPDWVSLAVNSIVARSQNQLHIHIDCLRADVHQSLAQHAGSIGPAWAPFAVPLAGAPYSAIKISDLNDINVFRLLAERLPGAREDMGRRTLVVGSPSDRASSSFRDKPTPLRATRVAVRISRTTRCAPRPPPENGEPGRRDPSAWLSDITCDITSARQRASGLQ